MSHLFCGHQQKVTDADWISMRTCPSKRFFSLLNKMKTDISPCNRVKAVQFLWRKTTYTGSPPIAVSKI